MVGGFGGFSVEVGFRFEHVGEDILCQGFCFFNLLNSRQYPNSVEKAIGEKSWRRGVTSTGTGVAGSLYP